MPIIIPKDIPAYKALLNEKIFVMSQSRAVTQDIRPIEIAIVNLMPTKLVTEQQLMRLLSNTPLQVKVTLIATASYRPKHIEESHLNKFYKNFEDVKHRKFDGMIITGAPVETLDFEDVAYWKELCEIMEWSKKNVTSTFHICWGAQAGLYYHYGIKKHNLDKKMFGIFKHKVDHKNSILFRGFDDKFMVPHSRHTTVLEEDIRKCDQLKILSTSEEAGVYVVATDRGRQIFVTGHSEYDANTLKKEYERDKNLGLEIDVPVNYFPDDDDTKDPMVTWRSSANLLYSNWLNYFVYQVTPYNIDEIE